MATTSSNTSTCFVVRFKTQNGDDITMNITPTSQLQEVFQKFLEKMAYVCESEDEYPYEFIGADGNKLSGFQTAREAGVENGDMIEAVMKKHVQLKVQYSSEKPVHFKLSRTSRLERMMETFCNKMGLQSQDGKFPLRFISCNGSRLREDQTPHDARLVDGEKIDAFDMQIAGCMGAWQA